MGSIAAGSMGYNAHFANVLAAVFIRPFLKWMSGFRRHLGRIEKAMGLLLILFGVLIATETINWIANWMVMYWPAFG